MNYEERVPATAGGFRIEKIANYEEDGKLADMKVFRYGPTYAEAYEPGEGHDYELEDCPNCHTGLGEAVVDPNVFTFMNFSTSRVSLPFQNLVVGIDEEKNELLENPFNSTNYPMFQTGYVWRADFNASNFRRLVNGRTPVIYSQVTVYDGDIDEDSNEFPGGKTVYTYDIMSEGYNLFDEYYENMFFEQPRYAGNVLVNDQKEFLYDKVKGKKDYSFNGEDFTLVREESNEWLPSIYSYSDWIFMNLYPDPYYPSINTTMEELFTSEAYTLGNARLDSKITTSYFSNGTVSNEEFYTFNNRNQIVGRITKNSDNTYTKRSFEYPEIKTNGPTPLVIQEMVTENLISPVIKDSTCIADSYELLMSNCKTISSHRVDYKEFDLDGSPYFLPSKDYQLDTESTGNHYVVQNEVTAYSGNGNPLEVIGKDGTSTCFLWGYRDRYMIASIANVSYTDVASILGGAEAIANFASNPNPTTSEIETFLTPLFSDIRTQHALISYYSYKSLVGMTSKTDANGLTTYYEYDSFGRLKCTKDDDGNILRQYEYHYKL
jgi:YD repeat-containing protein